MRKYYSFLLLLLFATGLDAQVDTTWRFTYGGTMQDHARSVKSLSDGNYIITGSTSSSGNGNSDIYLLKIDTFGNYLWSKTFGGIDVEWGEDIKETYDKGFIIAGYTTSFGAGGYDVYLVKTDSAGNEQWSKTYGGSDWDYAYSVQQTADSGYVIAGETYSFGAGMNDAYLIRTDKNGDTLWTKTYGFAAKDYARSVAQTFDGGYIFAGGTESFGAGMSDVYLVKTDSAGTLEWNKSYGGSNKDLAYDVIQTIDSGYATIGFTKSYVNDITVSDDKELYFFKTDGDGDILWYFAYGGPYDDEARVVKQRSNGNYAILGYTRSYGYVGTKDFYFIITQVNGWPIGGSTYGYFGEDDGYSFDFANDSGYILVGSTNSFGCGLNDVWALKVDTLALTYFDTTYSICEPLNIEDVSETASASIIIYPNPFNTHTRIKLSSKLANLNNLSFVMYNILGKEVITIGNISSYSFELSRNGLPQGIYFYELVDNCIPIDNGKLVID